MAYWTREAYEIGKMNAMKKPAKKEEKKQPGKDAVKAPEAKAKKAAGKPAKKAAGKPAKKAEAKPQKAEPREWVIEKEMDGQAYVLTDVSKDWSGCITYTYRQRSIDNAVLARVFSNEEKAREIAEKVRGTLKPRSGMTELSAAEAAEYLGIHQTVFNYHVRKLGIRAEARGHKHIYKVEDVRRIQADLRIRKDAVKEETRE